MPILITDQLVRCKIVKQYKSYQFCFYTYFLQNINASILRAIENLYDKARSAVLFNGNTGEWFRTIVGVRQGCLLSPILFNIFLGRIMCEALDDHEDSVSIGGRLQLEYMMTS